MIPRINLFQDVIGLMHLMHGRIPFGHCIDQSVTIHVIYVGSRAFVAVSQHSALHQFQAQATE